MRFLGIDIGGTSMKFALFDDGECARTFTSRHYTRPGSDELAGVLAEAVAGAGERIDGVGLCVPGIFDPHLRLVKLSVNVPGLIGLPLDEVIGRAVGQPSIRPRITNDAVATATDLYLERKLTGRLFSLAIGTGVGAAVLDDGARVLHVDGESPGHIGMIDVSLDDNPPVGPDGGAGSLEGYLGAAAFRPRFGDLMHESVASLPATDPAIRALVRTIRIAHALYRPNHVALAGGIGIRIQHLLTEIRRAVVDRLTNVARTDWTLFTGRDDFHAARGAARLAMTGD